MRKEGILVIENGEQLIQGILLRCIAPFRGRTRKISIVVHEITWDSKNNQLILKNVIGQFWWYLGKHPVNGWQQLKQETETLLEKEAPATLELGFPEIAVDRHLANVISLSKVRDQFQ